MSLKLLQYSHERAVLKFAWSAWLRSSKPTPDQQVPFAENKLREKRLRCT